MLVSAYFVPGEEGLMYLTGRADAGVKVSLLTNSLEATDVPAVHGGYAPYRKALLEHGVKLFELRRQPGDPGSSSGGSGPHLFSKSGTFGGGSDSSLHSKAMTFDRRKVFVGSFNFDPRSVLWNTEVGVLVDSPELTEALRELALQGMQPALSYEAKLEDGKVVWVTPCTKSPAMRGVVSTRGSAESSAWRKCSRPWLSERRTLRVAGTAPPDQTPLPPSAAVAPGR
jgi:putative cardiolipin synthase